MRGEKWGKEHHERRYIATGVGYTILGVLPHWEIRIVSKLPELRSAERWQHK